jgi:hypothetical protein
MNDMKKGLAGVTFSALLAIGVVHAASIASVALTGFIQNGTVTNDAASTANITSVVYSLGPAGDGIATWDGSTGGGVASDFLSNPSFFQTVTWSGLSVAPGTVFNFGGLDIDLIQTLNPLSVTGSILDDTGASLVGAFVTVTWSDGASGTSPLLQQAWIQPQQFDIASNGAAVPEPGVLGLLGLGALMMVLAARRRRAA